jgi:hypothetical protein
MVYNNESIDSSKPNKELPNSADIARNIQNRVSCRVGLESKEAQLFPEFFGTSMRVVKILWELVVWDKLRPRGGHPENLLWELYFMKVYPKQGLDCSVVCASTGAVDPKTLQKLVWAYIKTIAKLVDVVVSLLYFFQLIIDLLSTATASKGHRHGQTPSPSTGCCHHMPLSAAIIVSCQSPPTASHRSSWIIKKGGYPQRLSFDSCWD